MCGFLISLICSFNSSTHIFLDFPRRLMPTGMPSTVVNKVVISESILNLLSPCLVTLEPPVLFSLLLLEIFFLIYS